MSATMNLSRADDDDDNNDGRNLASSSSGKKPRGRPPGSKNKPKPPVVITRESESAMHPHVLEVAAGCDVLDAIAAFSRSRRIGLSLLSATGAVANVVLRHPTTPAAVLTLHGRFEMLSLSGTFLPTVPQPITKGGFAITVSGAQGQVVGGTLTAGLTAAGTVVVVAAGFTSPEFVRLPPAEEREEEEAKQLVPGQEMVLWGSPAAAAAVAAAASGSGRAPAPHLSLPTSSHY